MVDNIKDIKNRLYNYSNLVAEKEELQLRLKELRENIGPKGIDYSGQGHGSGISRTTENEALRITEAKEKLHTFIRHKGIEVARIENAISILNEKELEFIELKYFKKRKVDSIPFIIDRTARSCRRLEKSALMKIDSILNLKI